MLESGSTLAPTPAPTATGKMEKKTQLAAEAEERKRSGFGSEDVAWLEQRSLFFLSFFLS